MRVSAIERSVSSSLDSKFQATINVSPKAFKVLFDLYANKLESICRELMANCYDAHVSVGLNQPFVAEVVENNILDDQDPFLHFRDHGPGISKEDIQQVYMRFFESTKNDSNYQVGAFGLGAKSPWCYTEAYTVKSFQHGMVCTYALFLDASGYPNCALVSEELSEEHSGLEVIVPLKKNDVRQAREALRSLTVGYLLNGTDNYPKDQPSELPEKFIDFGDVDVYKMAGKVSILYGVTLYQLDNSVLNRLLERGSQNLRDAYQDFQQIDENVSFQISILVRVPLGILDLVPSRESLSYDEKSLVAILSVLEAKAENYIRAYNEKFSSRSSFLLARIWRGDRNLKHFFMRQAVRDLIAYGLTSRQCSIITSNMNGQFKVERGGSEKGFISFFSSKTSDRITVNPKIKFKEVLDSFELFDSLEVIQAKKALVLAHSRLRRIGNHKGFKFSLVSPEAATWLRDNRIEVLDEQQLVNLDNEVRVAKQIATRVARAARPKGGQFHLVYGRELKRMRDLPCKHGSLAEVPSDQQIARLNRVRECRKNVLLFPVDVTGPTAPTHLDGDVKRTRSGDTHADLFRRFLSSLKDLSVIRNSDVFLFYSSKVSPLKGFEGWSVLKGRTDRQLVKITNRMKREAQHEILSSDSEISNLFKLTNQDPLVSNQRDLKKCAREFENSLRLAIDRSPLKVNNYSWFNLSIESYYSIYGEVRDELKEEFIKDYPLLGILNLSHMSSDSLARIKDYIKMVDLNRKGEVYAVSSIG